jgi:non-ribosomal peptide synthase protein (TIGR01720 family)
MADIVPLLPTQQWILRRTVRNVGRYAFGFIMDIERPVELERLSARAARLAARHDALRMSFGRIGAGYVQYCGESSSGRVMEEVRCSTSGGGFDWDCVRIASELQTGLDVESGPLWQIAGLTSKDGSSSRVVIAVSHLIFDAMSRPLLLEGLSSSLSPEQDSCEAVTNAVTTRDWAWRLRRYAESPEGADELIYWGSLPLEGVTPLPRDFPGAGPNNYASSQTLSISLSEDETERIVRRGPLGFACVICAFSRACTEWTGCPYIFMDITGHGRDRVFDDLDQSGMIGCLTSDTPLLIQTTQGSGFQDDLRIVLRALSRIPIRGIGYGALRYMSPTDSQAARFFQSMPVPEVKFNYRGTRLRDSWLATNFRASPLAVQGVMHPQDHRHYVLNIEAFPRRKSIEFSCKFSTNIHRAETIARLLERMVFHIRDA